MRKSTKKKANFENEARAQEPSAKKNRSNNRIRNMDNDTTVEVFKYLKYCGLAKTSLVSKQFCDLIRTDRHKLARLHVHISMHEHTGIDIITGMKIFDKVLSAEEYNEWVIRNGYLKQIPLEIQTQMEGQVAGMEGTQYARKVYWLSPRAYEGSTPAPIELQIFHASIELSHENWPVFQHFFRLLTDPFVYIRHIGLPSQNGALNLLASVITPDFGRLQCHSLLLNPGDNNMQNVITWIKGHVHCYRIDITNCYDITNDDELLNFFMTGANCTSEIEVNFYDPCKTIGDLIQKFIDLKSGGEDKVVESIGCTDFTTEKIDALIRAYADFVVEGNVNQTIGLSNLVFEFVNNDIGKKLRLTIIRHGYVDHGYDSTEFTWKLQICNDLCLE